jgi:hypothetical protein
VTAELNVRVQYCVLREGVDCCRVGMLLRSLRLFIGVCVFIVALSNEDVALF